MADDPESTDTDAPEDREDPTAVDSDGSESATADTAVDGGISGRIAWAREKVDNGESACYSYV